MRAAYCTWRCGWGLADLHAGAKDVLERGSALCRHKQRAHIRPAGCHGCTSCAACGSDCWGIGLLALWRLRWRWLLRLQLQLLLLALALLLLLSAQR